MAGTTKAEFDVLYRSKALVPNGRGGFARSDVRLHYHRYAMESTVKAPWDRIVPILGLTSADKVVVVGSAFGWGVERLIELTGCQAIGVDISDYVDQTKLDTEEAEIDEAIIAAGFDPMTGHGLDVKTAAYTGEPKTKQIILKNGLNTNKARNEVKKEFGNSEPTWIISENVLYTFTDAEVTSWVSEANKLSTTQICHLLKENYPPNSKTAEEWYDLTGHTIITLGDFGRVG